MRRLHTVQHRGNRRQRSRSAGAASSDSAEAGPPAALQASVLVLNRSYMAIHVVGVRRAVALLFRDLAEVIHLENGTFCNYTFDTWREASALKAANKQPDEDWIRSVNFEFQVPRVIRLLSFDRVPKQHLQLNRRNILARDANICQYCGRHFPAHQLSLDHVVPRSRGGTTSWENVVCACLECNIRKGGRTPSEARMRLIRPPRKPRGNPVLLRKMNQPKYAAWRTWLDGAHWDIGARD